MMQIESIKAFESQDRTWAYLQLMRPANIVTAWADILAGFAASGAIANLEMLPWLLLATTGLYGGGIVFNDVFDAELDTLERPERPIPSGKASLKGAIVLGSLLLILGILAATRVSWVSTILAVAIALFALLYDVWGKHHPFISPLNMGSCRSGNLLLGMSAAPAVLVEQWYLALIPLLYIAAVTTMSRGEVGGGKRITGILALVLLAVVLGGLLLLGLNNRYDWLSALPFWGFFALLVVPSWIRATYTPDAQFIRKAVKAGIISLIVLNSTLTAGFNGIMSGLLVLSLLPLSLILAKRFSVT